MTNLKTNNPASYIGRLSSPGWLELLAAQLQGSNTMPPPAMDTHGGEQAPAKFSARLLVRLINETFLSVPLANCLGIESPNKWTESRQTSADVCRVDWTQTKLVQHEAASNGSSEQSEVLLANLFNSDSLTTFRRDNILSTTTTTTTTTFEHLNSLASAHGVGDPARVAASSHSLIDYNLVKLTYLSISSLLSICGILINLFIILIIIFNTKQKRRAILRSNNTGQNNLLLFQLTITGILLTSYILIDNVDIQNQSVSYIHSQSFSRLGLRSSAMQDSGPSNLMMTADDRWVSRQVEDPKFCGFLYQLPSLLFTFLPPTPFHWDHRRLCRASFSRSSGKQTAAIDDGASKSIRFQTLRDDATAESDDDDDEDDNKHDDDDELSHDTPARQDATLILISTKTEHVNHQDFASSTRSNSKSWLLDYDSQSRRSNRLVDLTNLIESVFVLKTNCKKAKVEQHEDITEKSLSSWWQNGTFLSVNPGIVASKIDFHYLKALALGLCPLLINVIAFIHIWTVAALAYDRYCAIAHPLQYLRSINASKTRTFFMLSWSVALVLNLIVPITLNQVLISGSNRTSASGPLDEGQSYQWFSQNDVSRQLDAVRINDRAIRLEGCESMGPLSANLYNVSCKLTDEDLSFERLMSLLYSSSLTSEPDGNNNTVHPNNVNQLSTELIVELATSLMRLSSAQYSRAFQETSSQTTTSGHMTDTFYIAILLVYSLVGFTVVILLPLLIITICNIRIYRIVKVHERRLSISSASNIAPNFPYNQRHNKYETNSEDRSEAGSIRSVLINKLFRVGVARAQAGRHHEPSQSCLPAYNKVRCDCERLSHRLDYQADTDARQSNPNGVNKSRRIIRQNSCLTLTKLATNDRNGSLGDIKTSDRVMDVKSSVYTKHLNNAGDSTILNYSSCSHAAPRSRKKLSDHFIGLDMGRKCSTSSQVDYNNEQRDSEMDAYSNVDSPLNNNGEQAKHVSGSIINQLKLAGLSFAGIAIQEPSSFANRSLQKSSSCSLGNLNLTQTWGQNHYRNCGSSVSRCSMETTSTLICPRKSYVSLNQPNNKHQDEVNTPTKCQTRLTDDDSDCAHPSNGPNINFHHSHQRLPFTIGTKSVAFNVVIWLILTMLLFTLPHYILVTIDQVRKLNSNHGIGTINEEDLVIYSQRLGFIVNLAFDSFASGQNSSNQSVGSISGQSLLHVSSIWLSCLCRVLFLSMIPLNGWLYGIRSKSLRASVKVVLRRYISKRQATIEIDQRQRSISSARSRDSSFVNLTLLYNQHCQQRAPSETSNRARRCSSLNACRPEMSTHRSSVQLVTNPMSDEFRSSEASYTDKMTSSGSDSKLVKRQSRDGIRFSIGESYITDRDSDDGSPPQPIVVPPHQKMTEFRCSSQSSSPSSSLAGSSKSLMSTSVHSPQSLLNERDGQRRHSGFKLEHDTNEYKTLASGKNVHELIYQRRLSNLQRSHNESSSRQHAPRLDREICSESTSNYVESIEEQTMPQSSEFHLGSDLRSDLNKKHKHHRRYSSSAETNVDSRPASVSFNSGHLKKSTSEFKFLITSADHDQHFNELNSQQQDEMLPLRGLDTVIHYEGAASMRTVLRNSGGQPTGDWWKDLKQNLTKLLLSASARLLAPNLVENGVEPARHHETPDRCSGCSSSGCKQVTACHARVRCRKSRLGFGRRNSNDNHHRTTKWRQNLAISTWNTGQDGESHSSNGSKFRNSISMDNFDATDKAQASGHHTFFEQTNGSTGALKSTYLKPPNFLKLIFDPNNQTGSYSGASALSPIKECSSNHSFASSIASLNNNNTNVQMVCVAAQSNRNLSKTD